MIFRYRYKSTFEILISIHFNKHNHKKEELSLSSSFLARHFIYSLIVQLTQ